MADWLFKRAASSPDGLALYRAEPAVPKDGRGFYFLLIPADSAAPRGRRPSSPPETLTFAESWQQIGAYIFAPIFQPDDLAALRAAIGIAAKPHSRALAWIAEPQATTSQAILLPLVWTGEARGQVSGRHRIGLLNIDLAFETGTSIEFDFEGDTGGRLEGGIVLKREGTSPGGLAPLGDSLTVVMTPQSEDPAPGALSFSANWRAQDFFTLFRDDPLAFGPAWGGEIRYFLRKDPGGPIKQFVFPLFQAPGPAVDFDFQVRLDPIAPGDPESSRFAFTDGLGPVATLRSDFGRTVAGAHFRLQPQSGMGFYLGCRPGDDDKPASYLAPRGTYAVEFDSAAEGRLMCGLTGLEFLSLASGDLLQLAPGRPAFADLSDAELGLAALADGGEAPLLDDRYTSSWLSVAHGAAQSAAASADYFSQPLSATNFDRRTLGTEINYAAAASSRIADAAKAGAFPLGLYGGIYPTKGGGDAESWPNAGVAGAEFTFLESAVLAPARFEEISKSASAGPVLTAESGAALAGGRSATPNGFLVEINEGGTTAGADGNAAEQGSWKRFLLGKSDLGELAFDKKDASGEVDRKLAAALLNDQSFLVLNDWKNFTEFESEVRTGVIDVRLSPFPEQSGARETVMIFKYATGQSLRDLAERVENWEDPAYFVGDAAEVEAARATILAAIAAAEDAKDVPGDPFRHFREVVAASPNWTGFLVLNAPVDGRRMPPDFQMLLGGIDGQLRAHHYGVETSKLDFKAENPEIEKTAFIGVIYHLEQEPPPGRHEGNTEDPEQPFSFRTTELIIEVRNSAIVHFSAEVAVTLQMLFGRAVYGRPLEPAANAPVPEEADENTLRIKGEYQVIDGIGNVVFQADLKRAFLFDPDGHYIRVLEGFHVTGASLNPITGDDDETLPAKGNVEIAARFGIEGDLTFARTPFPASEEDAAPLDLFGYGREVEGQLRGLPISGLSLDIAFELDQEGKRVAPPDITPNFQNILVSERESARREGSLLSGMPLRLVGFASAGTGLEAATKLGKQVNCVDILGNTTSDPSYALRFDLPLGSLGDLADTGVGLSAGLVLAWGENTSTPDNDAAALYVQLPGLVGGLVGFDLQGFVKTTFGDANLARVVYRDREGKERGVYVLLFNNVALSILGIRLPPKVVSDFILFSDPASPGDSDIAWNLAATQVD